MTNMNNAPKPVPVTNPAVVAAMEQLKTGSTPENQAALTAALREARLLVPGFFDATEDPAAPKNIHFYMINAKDGKTFFPAFTDIEAAKKGPAINQPNTVLIARTAADFDRHLTDPTNKASGIIINPGSADLIVTAEMIGRLSGRIQEINKPAKMAPVTNPEVDAAIAGLKEGPTPEKQIALSEALKKARLLSPCSFDIPVKPDENGQLPQLNPSQIKFYLVNTKDGKTFFPAFTDVDKSTKVNFTQDKQAIEVVRTMEDYETLLSQPGNKAAGIVINPGTDDIIVPRTLIARLCGKAPNEVPKTVNPQQMAPVRATFTEPSIYPTRMINAVYDRCLNVPEISKVYMKQKSAANTISFFFIVDSDVQEERILNEIREVSVPLSRDIPVEVVFNNPQLQAVVIRESTAIYDRDLEV